MKHIRSLPLIAAVALAALPCARASAQDTVHPSFQIKNLGDFAIKPSDLQPTGCTIISTYDNKKDRMLPTITCGSQQQFEAAFVFTNDKLTHTCSTADGKYVCKVTS